MKIIYFVLLQFVLNLSHLFEQVSGQNDTAAVAAADADEYTGRLNNRRKRLPMDISSLSDQPDKRKNYTRISSTITNSC
ncbi:unnamed protein product [Orchesella dallaii]|uniref:Uncharacterized protein n=1 Tax=Orchesella dallaii TaxID=48710 RepID=A0ABP1RI22_9HEXA